MGVPSVSNTYSASSAGQAASAANGAELDMDDFFTLMATELENQTMYDTVDNAAYMGQLAQFSMLSQMQELAQKSDSAYAVSFLGKAVEVKTTDDSGFTQLVSGTVEQVSFSNGSASVLIDGESYSTADIVSVQNG